jgi:hypothetical protein
MIFDSIFRVLASTQVKCDSAPPPPGIVSVRGGIMGASAALACREKNKPFLLIESNHSVITSS